MHPANAYAIRRAIPTDGGELKRLAQLGQTRAFGTPEQFGQLMRSEHERWGRVVKASGAKAD